MTQSDAATGGVIEARRAVREWNAACPCKCARCETLYPRVNTMTKRRYIEEAVTEWAAHCNCLCDACVRLDATMSSGRKDTRHNAELKAAKPYELVMKVEAPQPDPVNHPTHYTSGGIECIDAIEAALTPEEFAGFCKGNAMKYTWRARLKGRTAEDLRKAQWYINRELNRLERDT